MTIRSQQLVTLTTGLLLTAIGWYSASAFEPGQSPQTKGGATIGASAAPPPAGLYMIDQAFYYDFKLIGPGTTGAPGTRGFAPEATVDFLWAPGWSFLGAKYSALVAFPYLAVSIERAPAVGFEGISFGGVHNAFIQPLRLQWSLGNGFFVQAGAGVWVPTGDIKGPLGESNSGADYFTIQPHLVFSYVKDGWNLTSYFYYEHNTKNERSGYTSGGIFHADLTATRKFDKWTLGPVAYYIGQVTSDRPGAGLDAALSAAIPVPGGFQGFNAGKFEAFAVGGLVGYDFGSANLTVFATTDVFASATQGYSGTPFINEIPFANGTAAKGWTIFGKLSYQLWSFEAAPPGR
jgi:hypothetical protein